MPSLVRQDDPAHGGANGEIVRFCTYCARLEPEATARRVCSSCGLGVMLVTGPSVLARDGEALLVVSGDLRVSAASTAVDAVLGRPQRLIGVPIAALISSASPMEDRLREAVGGTDRVATLEVEPFGEATPGWTRRRVRIAGCGEPPAALLVFLSGG
ncbi:MAG: hypothetical protein NVSMB25_22680 [Thermoleophilaceae bacterium]